MNLTTTVIILFMLLGHLSIVIGAFLFSPILGFVVLGFALLISANALSGAES